MPSNLHNINSQIVDGENNPVTLDCVYSIKGNNLVAAVEEIKRVHGSAVCLLPLSGVSAGGGIFQVKKPRQGDVVGVQIAAVAFPNIGRSSEVDITQIEPGQIIIDENLKRVYAGGAITLEQLNQALGSESGSSFKVPGADLTSYTYAQVGATFMTGGMGPQRRYFSDAVSEISLHDGNQLIKIQGETLKDYAGTYGWTGLVTAVCCNYFELPRSEFAFAMPVNNSASELARLLEHFSPYAFLKLEHHKVLSYDGGSDLILGVEHITIESMQPFLQGSENELTARARQLQLNCESADADGLIFVNAYSNLSIDDFLLKLVDDTEQDELTIAGIQLEHTEVFNNPDQMRAVREAIPFAARTRAPKGKYVFKGHTDANICLNRNAVSQSMYQLWLHNQSYVSSVQDYFNSRAGLCGQILVYGHLNPVGVDPHNRITLACDDEAIFHEAVGFIHAQRDLFVHNLKVLCDATGSIFIGGEKGAGSEIELFDGLGGVEFLPVDLARKFQGQSRTIKASSRMFNWRAPAPYI